MMLVDLDLHGLAFDSGGQAPRLGRADQVVEAVLDDEPNPRGGGGGRQLLGRPHRGDLAAVEEEHPVADLGHLVHVVRGVKNRDPGTVPLLADEVADLVGDVRVKRRRRLVQQRDPRPREERLGQHHPRRLPGREAGHRPPPQVPHPEPR